MEDLKKHGVTWIYVSGAPFYLQPSWAQNVDFPSIAKQYGIKLVYRIGGQELMNFSPTDTEMAANIKAILDQVLADPILNEIGIGWGLDTLNATQMNLENTNYWLDFIRNYDPKHRPMVALFELARDIPDGLNFVAGDRIGVEIPWGTKSPIPIDLWWAYYGYDETWQDTSKTADYVRYIKEVVNSKYPQCDFLPFDYETYIYDVNPISYRFSSAICPTEVMKARIAAIRSVVGNGDIWYQPYFGYYQDHDRDHSFYGDGREAWKALVTPTPSIAIIPVITATAGLILTGMAIS